ncbi:MAG: hypothetical protein HRT61_01130 [Ekhidna sp.]|nr:hypothetical protein [Ekhidna sp.]
MTYLRLLCIGPIWVFQFETDKNYRALSLDVDHQMHGTNIKTNKLDVSMGNASHVKVRQQLKKENM